MMLAVDPRDPTPPFEQLRVQIIELARRQELPPGARLPTVRRLAGDLGIAPNTVARAYRELEQAGVIETRGRHGTFVAHRTETTAQAAEAAKAYATQVHELGITPVEGLALVTVALGFPPAKSSTSPDAG